MTKQEIANELPPKRIYHWLNSQLSIARFSGGCILNGVQYIIRYDLEGQPLEEVRPKPKKKSQQQRKKSNAISNHNVGQLETSYGPTQRIPLRFSTKHLH